MWFENVIYDKTVFSIISLNQPLTQAVLLSAYPLVKS